MCLMRGLKLNTYEIAFQGRHDEEEIEVCRICFEKLERTITYSILKGPIEGKRNVSAPRKTWMKYILKE